MSTAPPPDKAAGHGETRLAVALILTLSRFLCGDCSISRSEDWYCPACAQRMVGLFAGSWLAIAAGISAFLGLGCAPLAAVAAVLALSDLAMIASGRGAKGGWKLDLIALGLSAIGLVIGAFVLQRLGLLSAASL
jgi:hypothetical protein